MFNLLESIVESKFGEQAWDDLLAGASASGSYTSLGNYPDAELMSLIAGAAGLRGGTASALRWYGREAMPLLAQRYPVFFEGHSATRSFLLTLNDIIHTEVRKVYPGADVPDFDFELASDDRLVLGYRSGRRMCALAEGLIEGAADHYAERVTIDRPRCMLRGDDNCLLVCSFAKSER